jgi:threonine dehydratase
MTGLALAAVLAAREALWPHIWSTPLLPSPELSRLAGGPVFLKLECWQRSGSFKVRGALNRLATITPGERARGVTTASTGNHALGIAFAARAFGLSPPVVFLPEGAAANKVRRLAFLGCEIRPAGPDYDSAHLAAEAYAREHGAPFISPCDDPVVIAGQGSIGLEVLEALPDADVLLVPVGGGGLIAGTATAARAIRPSIRIVGLQPEASPAAYLSLRDRRPYETYSSGPTICDGLAGGFGRLPFEIAADMIDEVLVVPEQAIRRAVAWLLIHEQLLVEGSGAIAIAPLLTGQLALEGRKVAAVLTGRNLDPGILESCLTEFRDP